jgi:molybdopterin converting factor small subunit
MSNVYVSLFGALADVTGNRLLVINDVKDIQSLNKSLHNAFPGLKKFSYKIALKQRFVNGNEMLINGDEVALLPPFAGG